MASTANGGYEEMALNSIKALMEDLDIQNHEAVISSGSEHGDNYFGVITAVTVTGQDKIGRNTKLNLLVKMAQQNKGFREIVPLHAIYEREIYVYQRVMPQFTKFQKEVGVQKVFNSFPKFYTSSMEEFKEFVVMENMKASGFRMVNRHKTLNSDHVLLALREYGRFHALSFALRDQKPDVFEKIAANTQEAFYNNFYTSQTLTLMERDFERALESLNPIEDKTAFDQFQEFKNMLESMKRVLQSESAGKYAVIAHGDSWTNNMLFKYGNTSNTNEPTEICLLDWQLVRVCSPILDVAYFIFTSTDKETRDRYYDEWLREYYKSLAEFLRELGSDPEQLFPYTIFQEHLKTFSVFGLHMAIGALHWITNESEDIPEVDSIMPGFDITTLAIKLSHSDKYNSRMRGIILDFVQRGYDLW